MNHHDDTSLKQDTSEDERPKVMTRSDSLCTLENGSTSQDGPALTVTDETVEIPEKQTTHSLTGRVVAIGLMILSGCCVALQAGFNATLNAQGGRSFAALVSFSVGLGCCLIFFSIDLTLLHTPPPQRLTQAPWYAWIGGILGTYYVVINILTVPKLGAATVLSVFVCSQVITACLIDHFGLVQVPKRRYTIWRILASLGLIGCVAVITIF